MNNISDKKDLILDNLENIPESYKEFMSKKDRDGNFYYSFKRKKKTTTLKKEYWIWGMHFLEKNTYSNTELNCQILSDEERYFKNIEGVTVGIDTECIKKSFAFGMVYGESGYLFFHPENHSVWEIYLDDLYVHPLADSFDEFLQNAKYLPNF